MVLRDGWKRQATAVRKILGSGVFASFCNICESVTKDFGDEIKPANQLIIDTQQAQQHMTIHHS